MVHFNNRITLTIMNSDCFLEISPNLNIMLITFLGLNDLTMDTKAYLKSWLSSNKYSVSGSNWEKIIHLGICSVTLIWVKFDI